MNEEEEGKDRKGKGGREGGREERNGGGKKKMGCTRASGIRKAKQNRSKNNNIESNITVHTNLLEVLEYRALGF